MAAATVWETLQLCWLNVYIEFSDLIIYDAGTNLTAKKFRQNATTILIQTKEVPVKAHNSIGKV